HGGVKALAIGPEGLHGTRVPRQQDGDDLAAAVGEVHRAQRPATVYGEHPVRWVAGALDQLVRSRAQHGLASSAHLLGTLFEAGGVNGERPDRARRATYLSRGHL